MVQAGDDLPALIAAGLVHEAARRCAIATSWWWRRRSSPRPRGAPSIWPAVTASARAIALGGRDRQGPAPGRGHPVRSRPECVRSRPNLLIMQHRLGFVMANAGVDQSNVRPQDGAASRAAAAAAIRTVRRRRSAMRLRRSVPGEPIGVIISDSFGRPWRRGTAGIAIGAAGLPSLIDLRGSRTCSAARWRSASSALPTRSPPLPRCLQGQADEARPVVVVRGLTWSAPDATVADLVRPAAGGSVPVIVALSGGVGGAKLALGLVAHPAAREPAGGLQYRRRFRTSRPVDFARHRYGHVHAGRGWRIPELGWGRRDETWSFMETTGYAWRRDLVPAGRSRPRGACGTHPSAARGESLIASHRGSVPAALVSGRAILPMSDDPVRTAAADRFGLDRLSGLFCAQPLRTGRAGAGLRGGCRGASPSGLSGRACRPSIAGRRAVSVQPVHQCGTDPGDCQAYEALWPHARPLLSRSRRSLADAR